MARQTKTYQVKFETKGFSQIAEAFGSINAGISKTQKNFQNLKYNPNLDRPRNQLGQFTDQSQLKLEFELKRLNRSLEKATMPLQRLSRGIGNFAYKLRPISDRERNDRAFSRTTAGLSPDSRGLANALRMSMREQTSELVKSIEKGSVSQEGFNPISIAGGALSGLTKAILMPLEATLFGAFEGFGETLTKDFSKGFISQTQKSLGLDFNEVGKDIGEILGEYVYKVVDETASAVRNINLDSGSNPLIHLEKAGNKLLEELVKAVTVQAGIAGAKAYRRIRINKESIPSVQRMAGRGIIEKRVSPRQREEIDRSRSITLAVGGYNKDPNDFGKDYTSQLLKPLMGESAVIPVERKDLSKGLDPVFERQLDSLVQGAMSNPDMKKSVTDMVGGSQFFQNLSATEKKEFFGDAELNTADPQVVVDLVKRIIQSEEFSIAKVIEQVFRGYGLDDVVVASEALRYRQEFPDKPINIVGFSQGGLQAAGATEILQKMGVKGVKGVGIGTNFTGAEYSGNREDFMSFTGDEDYYSKAFESVKDAITPALCHRERI